MEEKELPFEYKAVEEGAKSFNIARLKREVFGSTSMMPGSGEMLALKLVLQSLDNFVLVTSGVASIIARKGLGVPVVCAENPAGFAQGLAHALKDKSKAVVFADEQTTISCLPSVIGMKEDMLYICYRNAPSFRQLAGMMQGYSATASIAFYEDFMIKLKKAFASGGFSYIEVMAPNPSWGYEPSNTVEIARLATECLLWPIYEVENGVLSITKRPDKEEPVERFFAAIKSQPPAGLQEEASRAWKLMQKVRQEA